MISRIDIKLILIASLFAVLLSIFVFPLLQTLLYFLTDIQLDRPIGAYLLRGYFPLLLAGLYAGLAATKSVLANGVMVGIVYSFTNKLISIIFINSATNISWMSMIYGLVEDGIICGLIAWVTFKTVELLKKKGQQNV